MDVDSMTSEEVYLQAMESKRNDKIEEAVRLFKIASEKGNEYAMNELGEIYETGYEDVPKNINESMTYYQMSADAGNIKGLKSIINLIISGKIQFDINIHIKYFEMALDKGELNIAFSIIKMYYNGTESVAVDKERAAKLLKIAADKNYDITCYLYAKMLFKGDGIAVQKKLAAKYLERMTKRKYYHKYGSLLYGLMLYQGEVVPRDIERASFLFKKAADLGNVQAMYCYGKMMAGDEGIEGNRSEAIKYLQQASDLGYEDATLWIPKDESEEPIDDDDDRSMSSNESENSYVPMDGCVYFMKNKNGFYSKKDEGSYLFDGTYLMPYKNYSFQKNRIGSYKFDGKYLMRFDGHDFVKNKPKTFKYEGNYLMAFDRGYRKENRGSFKIDGKNVIPYVSGCFNILNPGTFVFDGESIAPFKFSDYKQRRQDTIKLSKYCRYGFLFVPFINFYL